MQCPACTHNGSAAEFGSPARCPQCGAFYEKALVARAKRTELAMTLDERQQRQQRVDGLKAPAVGILRYLDRGVRRFFANPWTLGIGLCLVLLAVLDARGKFDSARPQAQEKAGPDEWQITEVGNRAVRGRLKDPDSAQFRGQFVGKAGVPCGEVNSKNAFGGYVGYQRYIASGGGLVFFEQEVAADEFEAAWLKLCR